jgi:glycosyltransferase involved in cell wall biosynthesis
MLHAPSAPRATRATRPRVLLIAELANPDWVSVPLEGWCLFEALSRVADVHLVTHIRNEENIVRAGLPRVRFTAIDNRVVERPLLATANVLRGTREPGGVGQTLITAFSSFAYYAFEDIAWRRLGHRIRAADFDVVHRLTPLNPTIPSILAARCAKHRVPFVIGPMNGGLPWLPEFSRERRQEREWLTYVRGFHRLMPGYVSTRRDAAAIIAGSRDTLGQIAAQYRSKCVYVPENGVDPGRFDEVASGPVDAPLRVAYVGRLVPYKMPGLLLEAALPLLKRGRARLEFFGDGPELPKLKARVAAEGLGDAVSFAGWVAHAQLKQRLRQAHVFGFPSIREFGGAVVLEAMATGLVPVVVDYGGPGEHVSPGTGFAVPIGPPEHIVQGVRAALTRLADDPGLVRPIGERARARVLKSFTWDAKAAQVLEVYRWVLGQRDKPDFGMPLPD